MFTTSVVNDARQLARDARATTVREEQQLITPAEAATLLRVQRQTIYQLINVGELPAILVGHQWRIPREKSTANLSLVSSSIAPP